MTAKQLKFYQILKKVNTLNVFTEMDKLLDSMKQVINLDYYAATELWEFLILDNESKLQKDIPLAAVLCDKISQVFETKALTKYVKTLSENPVICRAAYTYSPSCYVRPESVSHLVTYLVPAKIDDAAEILSCANKNTSNKATFGEFMKAVVEKLFIELLKKADDGRVRINRKTAALVQEYINKIKGPEKALLTQRLKEVQ